MVKAKKLESCVAQVSVVLRKREKAQDALLALSRETVRGCAVAIKTLHAGDKKQADKDMVKVAALVKKARAAGDAMQYVASQSYQEFCEARVLLAVMEDKEIPSYEELGIPFEPYLLGLMDVVGEFRREMLEELKRGSKAGAERYFEAMNAVYEATLPLKFSNSILPGFRRKQDVARMQLESARSELLR